MSFDVFALLLVLFAALLGGAAARRFGYPSILGELGAGIILGPPILGLLQSDSAVAVIGKLGVVLLMLYIGLHLDPSDLGRAASAGALASLGGFLVPAGLGFGLMMLVEGDAVAAAFVAVAMGVTSLATKSRILVDLGILNTRIAHVLMAGALFSDVAALIFFSVLLGLAATGTLAISGIGITAVKAGVFLLGSWVIGTRVFPWLGRLIERRKVNPSLTFLLVISAGLGFAAAAEAAGLHGILGAFLAGLFIRDGVLPSPELRAVEERVRGVSVGLLAPVFFVTAGFGVSFDVFTEDPMLLFGVVALATVGKVVGTALFYLPTGNGFREGIAVGAGMNGRGAVEIIVAELALEAGLIDVRVFSILVFMAIFTTATVPVLLTAAIRWLRRHGELVTEEREGVVIIGAGPVARELGKLLDTSAPVTLVDTNTDHSARAREAGLATIDGSGLDTAVLAEAGAPDARTLIAATPNTEVNLLAASIARKHFGIPQLVVALGHESPGVMSMLDDIGATLMFGREVDLADWDADLDRGRTEPLMFEMEDAEEALEDGRALNPSNRDVESLPLVVSGGDTTEIYSPGRELHQGDVIVGIGRPSTLRSRRAMAG